MTFKKAEGGTEGKRMTFCVLKCDSWFLFTSNCISLENWELTQGN